METLEERFNTALEKWRTHCRRNTHFSFAQAYLDSDAYREIVSMGPDALPLIRHAYATENEALGNPGQFWAYAVHAIVGDAFRIEVREDSPVTPITQGFVGIDVKGVKQFTLSWLDENIPKYVHR